MKNKTISAAEKRSISRVTRQNKKELKKNGRPEVVSAITAEPSVAPVKRNNAMIVKAMIALQQMVNGKKIEGNLLVNEVGDMTETQIEEVQTEPYVHISSPEEQAVQRAKIDSIYRSRSKQVNPPYSQKVFDSLGGSLQGDAYRRFPKGKGY